MPSAVAADKEMNVAVIGGGIGGLCLAIALQAYPQIKVQIYEAWPSFVEIGAGVSFGPNARRALSLISPETAAAYAKVACNNGWSEYSETFMTIFFGEGQHKGELAADVAEKSGNGTLHRARFLEELVKLIPPGTAQFDKRLEKIDELEDGRVQLHFKDSATVTADCLVGADGIHSTVREHVLGSTHPALRPVFAGFVGYRVLAPMEQAIKKLGEERARNCTAYIGGNGVIMTYPVDDGNTLNAVAIDKNAQAWDGPTMRAGSYPKIEAAFTDWDDISRAAISLFDSPRVLENQLQNHPSAPYYNRGRVVMMGDAAHATTPFQGQGAGQAIEDALVLGRVLGAVTRPDQFANALRAFDAVRRPRANKVVDTSREMGQLVCLTLPGTMDDKLAVEKNINTRFKWIWDNDLGKQVDGTLDLFNSLETATSVACT